MHTETKITKESFGDYIYAIKRVVSDVWNDHKKRTFILFFISTMVAITPFAISGAQAFLINHLVKVLESGKFDRLLLILILITAFAYLLQEGMRIAMGYWQKMSWYDVRQKFDLKLSDKLGNLDVATHENPEFQDKVQVVNDHGSSFVVSQFFESFVMNTQNLIGFVVASSIVIIADWRLFVLIFIASIPRFYAELRYGQGIWSIYQSQSEDRRQYIEARRQTESVHSIREMQTFQSLPFFLSRQKNLLSRFYGAQKREENHKLLHLTFAQVLITIAIGLTFFILVMRVVDGAMQIGTFTFVVGSVIALQNAVAGFFLAVATQHRDARPVKAFFDILSQERYIKKPHPGYVLNLQKAPVIEFQNVSFSYPTKPDTLILKNFSLRIESGEKMALVGVNGAGKSTLIKLLCRFYDPTEGKVLINGTDIRDLDLDSWYHNVALLAQDYQTYRFKTWEVVGLGRLNGKRDQARIEKAAQRAQAASFIEAWEEQYDQQIGVEFKGGIDPSKGQKQKLALARTIYRDASVVILDEPTAHVDAEAEQSIFDHLEKEMHANQTLLLVSHRFSTVRSSDRICVIKDGSVHELGSHDHLISQGGTYSRLFESQAKGYR